MGSPAPKSVSPEILAALAAVAEKPVVKLPVGAAANVRKSKYVGRKALKGAVQRLSHVASAYQG